MNGKAALAETEGVDLITAASLVIRPMILEDQEELVSIQRDAVFQSFRGFYDDEVAEAFASQVSPDRFQLSLDAPQRFVALTGTSVVGFGSLKMPDVVGGVYVRSDMQGLGVGKGLLATVEDEALKKGREMLKLEATLNAVRFYVSQGFLETAEVIHRLPGMTRLEMRVVKMEKLLRRAPQGR